MVKKIVAVRPYIYKTGSNFKYSAFEAWKNVGGEVIMTSYPPRLFHFIFFRYDILPSVRNTGEARLCFAQPNFLTFDTSHSVMTHEIIPFLWDCWPKSDEKLIIWLKRHNVKTCIITSSEAAERIKKQLPYLNIMVVSEGIDVAKYKPGKELVNRTYDVYYYGRQKDFAYDKNNHKGLNVVYNGNDEVFYERLQDAKITVAVPRCDVVPQYDFTGGQETLTQRFWECMLSRMVMVGRAPKELIDLIGYDPVIPIDYVNYNEQITEIISHIEDYQSIVDKNRETALRMAPWEIRMKHIMAWLENLGYEV